MGTGAGSLEELQRLVRALEQSGLAERRPDAAALLARSRAVLGGAGRPRRRRARARARLRALLLLLLDAAAVGVGLAAVVSLLAGGGASGAAPALLTAALGWGGLRAGPALVRLAVAGAGRLRWWTRWAACWLAEPFSEAAFARLEAMEEARVLMRAWHRHRATLPEPPDLAAVAAFLAGRHGPRVARRFGAAAEAMRVSGGGWTLRGRGTSPWPEERLLRWAPLITLFEEIAAGGALWEEEAPPPPPPVPTLPPARILPREPQETPERRQRRIDLRELIRRKRREIDIAHGWKLKTPAEVAQRDIYLNQLRAEVAALEAELKALGPEGRAGEHQGA